ncbi:MAG: hypothetical protein AABZ39_05875 [Spirochaetota bacterium]
MKAKLLAERCPAQSDMRRPIAACPKGAVVHSKDESAPLGGRIDIDDALCDGCGICVPLCCGNAIAVE